MNDELIIRSFEISSEGVFASKIEIDGLSDRNVDYSQETLILLLELLLIEDLDSEDTPVFDVNIERLVPIRVQCFLDCSGRVCLLAIDGDNREWVR